MPRATNNRVFALSAAIFFCLCLCQQPIQVTSTQQKKLVVSSPEDVGLGHTHIIHNLQEGFRRKLPRDGTEYLHAISLEVQSSACDAHDMECNRRIVRSVMDMIPGPKNAKDGYSHVKSILPENFDGEVMDAMGNLFFGLSLAEMESTENVIALLHRDMQTLKQNDKVQNEEHRNLALAAFSVGMESTKQWTEIVNDPNNPFNNMLMDEEEGDIHTRRRRQLQFGDLNTTDLNVKFKSVLQSDVIGAVTGAMNGLFDSTNKTTITFALEESSVASLKAFSSEFFGIDMTGGGDECTFPFVPWCIGGGDGDGDDDSPCLFPNLPFCGGGGGGGGGDDDYCPFPELDNCGLELDDSQDDSSLCGFFPSLPQCSGGGGGGGAGGDDAVSGGDDTSSEGDDSIIGSSCTFFPMLPHCQNGGAGGGGDDTPPSSGGDDTPPLSGGDDTPPLSGGDDTPPLSGGDDTDDWNDDTPIGGGGPPPSGTPPSGTPPSGIPPPSTNDDNPDCPYPNLPNCGNIPSFPDDDAAVGNPICDVFPNSPFCRRLLLLKSKTS